MAETSGFSTDLPQSAYLSLSIRRAISAAQQRSHRYVTLEHLLLALLDDPDALRLLEAVNADIPAIRMSVADTVNRNLATLYTPGQFDLRASYKVERVLQTASDDANRLGCAEVDAAFVLAGLSRESDNPAADILKRNRFAYSGAMTWIYANRGVSMARRPAPAPAAQPAPARAEPEPMPAPEPAPAPAAADFDEFSPSVHAREHEPEPLDEELADIEEEDDPELELEILDHDEPDPAPPPRPAPAKPLERLPEIIARSAPVPPPSPVRAPAATAPASARIGAASAAAARVQPVPAPVKAPPPPAPETAPAEQYRPDRWASETAPPVAPAPPNLAPRRREVNGGVHEPAKPAAAGPAPRRAPEAKVPSASRLDEMRVRATAPGAEHSRAPLPAPVPPPSDKKVRRTGKPAAAPQAKASAPSPAPAADKQKARQRRPARPGDTLMGKLVENIPRRMRAAVPERIEVRISREETQTLARGMEGGGQPVRHDVMVTQTMSVALRAPDGGFTIEPLSPETQWIFEKPAAGEDAEMYGRWRWMVTPHERGQRRLQVVVAARSIDHSGLVGDTPLPDQIITIRVRTNYLRAFGRALQWAILMVIGGVLTEAALMGMKIFTGGE